MRGAVTSGGPQLEERRTVERVGEGFLDGAWRDVDPV